ncbi:hypothetical protein KXV92_007764, partial [Aspergillus fumigatus]
MRPATLVAALLSLGGLELVAAENAQELKPRFIPKQFKRHVVHGPDSSATTSSNTNIHLDKRADVIPFISYFNSLLQNGPPATSSAPLVSLPIIVSIDASGVTHTITPTPTPSPSAETSSDATSGSTLEPSSATDQSAPNNVPATALSTAQTSSPAKTDTSDNSQTAPASSPATSSGNTISDTLSAVVSGVLGDPSSSTSTSPP